MPAKKTVLRFIKNNRLRLLFVVAFFGVGVFAMNFLQEQIVALGLIDNYVASDFIPIYVGLILQLPVLLFLIHSEKPFTLKSLLKFSRWVLLGALIFGALVTPTRDIFNQLLAAAPAVIVYQIGVIIVMISMIKQKQYIRLAHWNEQRSLTIPDAILEMEEEEPEEELSEFEEVLLLEAENPQPEPESAPEPVSVAPVKAPQEPVAQPDPQKQPAKRRSVNDFTIREPGTIAPTERAVLNLRSNRDYLVPRPRPGNQKFSVDGMR